MKKTKWLAIATAGFLVGAPMLEAEAKRLGGGGNIGRVAPSQGAKPGTIPAKPAQPQSAPQAAPQGQQAAKPAAASPAAAQPARSSWMGPLAGIAAGLGLAALASYLGFGEELMSLMLILLAVVAVFALFRILSARRAAQAGGYGQPAMAKSGYGGNDLGAEARPSNVQWPAASHPSVNTTAGAPAGVASAPAMESSITDTEIAQFVNVAREQFTKLQAIWDSGDIHGLAEFCTPEMTRELSHQIAGRKGAANVTQVVSLDAEWLGMSDSTDDYGKPVDEVQIRFSGLIRESAEAAAVDFDEVWTLHRVKGGDMGWMLAGITQVE